MQCICTSARCSGGNASTSEVTLPSNHPLPVQVLRRRCEHELGSDGFELLHSLCLANGGQLTRPLDLEARDNVT